MNSAEFQGIYNELIERMETVKVIDTHEHLPAESERLACNPDFFILFSHYCTNDLQSVGMPQSQINILLSDNHDVAEKWGIFKPYYDLIHDGAYCRAARIAMNRFYYMDDIRTPDDAEILSGFIRASNTEGLYTRVLVDACHICKVLNFGFPPSNDGLLLHVPFIDRYAEVPFAIIRELEDQFNTSCSSLAKYESAVRAYIEDAVGKGAKGLKFGIAYARDLSFEPNTQADAERVFNRIIDEGHGSRDSALGYEERRPLMNYMVHRICEIAASLDIPVVFHSAMQASIMHKADDARPLRLWNLPNRHRKTTFVLLHGGFPWMEDGALLAKHFPNVYLDMTWTHIMSPDISTRALGEWIDLVPINKIMAFGGDYSVVEKVYGHLVLAKRSIATALARKVSLGDLSIERAHLWIQSILHDNAARIYKIQ